MSNPDIQSWFDPRTVTAIASNIIALGGFYWNIRTTRRNREVEQLVDQFDKDLKDPLYEALSTLSEARAEIQSKVRLTNVVGASNDQIGIACGKVIEKIQSVSDDKLAPTLSEITSLLYSAEIIYRSIWSNLDRQSITPPFSERQDSIFSALGALQKALELLDGDSKTGITLDYAKNQVSYKMALLTDAISKEEMNLRGISNDLRSILATKRLGKYRRF